jgi:putative addiction module antidote
MLALKVIQVGPSSGVILSREALSALNVKRGDMLYLTRDADGSLRVAPQASHHPNQSALLEQIFDQDGELLAELAKR